MNARNVTKTAAVALVLVAALAGGCDESEKGETQEKAYDVNLLTNGSFEEVGRDGIPKGWTLTHFRGLPDEQEVEYRVDETDAVDGRNSWHFKADPLTRRFYMLTQELDIGDATHVRLRGWIRVDGVQRMVDQFSQCNFLLTFFDENHNRFQEFRIADKRTRLAFGTRSWAEEDHVFRVSKGTRYVMVSCILGMNGSVWFDDVSLSIPEPREWVASRTRNYEFYNLPGHPFPEGSRQRQQEIFDFFCSRLGVESDVVLKYYLYPDTATIREALSLRGYQYVSWDDKEIHTIQPNDNHETLHFITDPYGKPPRSFAEGSVFWAYDDWLGHPVDKVAAFHYVRGSLPTIENLTNYNQAAMIDAGISLPAAASFLKFVVDRWGTKKMLELFDASNGLNNYTGFAQAFEIVYGVPAGEVEEAWHVYLGGVDISDLPDPKTVPDP